MRQTRAVGAVPDQADALRVITAVAIRANETWATRRSLDGFLLEEKKEGTAKAA
jgi:hypothetical protein